MNDWALPEVFAALRNIIPDGRHVYLVGGAVRDSLRNRESHDLDFVTDGRAIPLARKLADRLHAAFYIMDEENDVARVLGKDQNGSPVVLDFISLRGPDLQADLLARDFTINAMAVDICATDQIIDPLNGALDLKNNLLRACSPVSLSADPLRVVRAVRQSVAYGLRIDPQTYQWMKAAAPDLARISTERQRDELFRILSGHKVATAIRLLDQTGALSIILPELAPLKNTEQSAPHVYNVWEHTLALLDRLEALLNLLVGEYTREASDLTLGMAVLRLGRFRAQFEQHFNTPIHPNRSLRALLFLAGLYHDVAKPLTRSVDDAGKTHFYKHDLHGTDIVENRARTLALSNPEIERLKTMVRNHMRPHHLANDHSNVNRRIIYRYFRASGAAGVEMCLLALADVLAVYGPTLVQERWQAELDVCRTLLEAWWETPSEIVHPSRLLSGDDLQQLFDLKPGPHIGELLEALAEAQAAGEISDRTAAEAFIRSQLG